MVSSLLKQLSQPFGLKSELQKRAGTIADFHKLLPEDSILCNLNAPTPNAPLAVVL